MQGCQSAKFFMESNDVGTYLDGWGMSIATQRAKERENQTPDVDVMAETVSGSGLIRGVRVPGVWGCGHPGWSGANNPGVRVPGGSGCGCLGWSAGMHGGSGCPGVADL